MYEASFVKHEPITSIGNYKMIERYSYRSSLNC